MYGWKSQKCGNKNTSISHAAKQGMIVCNNNNMRKRCRNVHTQQVFVIVCFQLLYITSQIVLFNSPWLEITCMLACTWCCLCLLNIFRYNEITLIEASWINCLCDADWKQRYGERVLCPPKQQSYSWLL